VTDLQTAIPFLLDHARRARQDDKRAQALLDKFTQAAPILGLRLRLKRLPLQNGFLLAQIRDYSRPMSAAGIARIKILRRSGLLPY
jgi:hypothetical protein